MSVGNPGRARASLLRAVAVVALAAVSLHILTASPLSADPAALDLTGDLAGVGDPTVGVVGGTTYLYSTGPGIEIRSSTDLRDWQRIGRVFPDAVPAWAASAVPSAGGVWAPDLSWWAGMWHLYYSVSQGSLPGEGVEKRSVIGHATNPTLDPADPLYGWTDHGLVVASTGTDPITAIDPDLVLDDTGQPHLAWGSYREGLVMQAVDPTTGILDPTAPRIPLAQRPKVWLGLEAATIIKRDGWWYLFASFDWCCIGELSNYNVRVGRSHDIAGPYVDIDGRPMLDNGGTLILESSDSRRGPGHQDIHRDTAGNWWILHHWEATEHGSTRRLGISPLTWTADGWPHLVGGIVPTPTTTTPATTPANVPTTTTVASIDPAAAAPAPTAQAVRPAFAG